VSYEPEHEELHEELHDAFGDQVGYLEIGPSPTAQVMKGGAVLRAKRRVALVSGMATLAVLPVAAVAVFAAGGNRTDTPASGHKPPKTLPSPTVTLPKATDGPATPPSPNDDIKVLADGTFGGQQWRLVRDQFVTSNAGVGAVPEHPDAHLPLAQRGRSGIDSCEFIGFQWGDRPAGSTPDFKAGGMCGPDSQLGVLPETVDAPSGTRLTETDHPIMALVGRVDGTKVASVTLTVGDAISAPQPVVTVFGEHVGYYVFFVRTDTTKVHPPAIITGYDVQGSEVGHADVGGSINLG
jgi:hypothetical protein